jgi:seryl-tRNA synthetase
MSDFTDGINKLTKDLPPRSENEFDLNQILVKVENLFGKVEDLAQTYFFKFLKLDETEEKSDLLKEIEKANTEFIEHLNSLMAEEKELITALTNIKAKAGHRVNNTEEINRVNLIKNHISSLKIYKQSFHDAIDKAGEVLNKITDLADKKIEQATPGAENPPLIKIEDKV